MTLIKLNVKNNFLFYLLIFFRDILILLAVNKFSKKFRLVRCNKFEIINE